MIRYLVFSSFLFAVSALFSSESGEDVNVETPKIFSFVKKARSECYVENPSRIDLRHREHSGVGYDRGYTSIEAFITSSDDKRAHSFFNFLTHILNNGKFAANIGAGGRVFLGEQSFLGGNFYYDYRQCKEASFHQIGPGIEYVSQILEVRGNGYIPIGATQQGGSVALPSVYLEVGKPFSGIFRFIDLYLGVGPYYLFNQKVEGRSLGNIWGGKIRLSSRLFDGVLVGVDGTYDPVFHTRVQGYISLSFPYGPANLRKLSERWRERYSVRCKSEALRLSRIAQSVKRNEIIPVRKL